MLLAQKRTWRIYLLYYVLTQAYLFLLSYTHLLQAQLTDIHFENIGVEEGLPSSFVVSVAQDKYGYIWFATNNGLTRYNGYQFTNFVHDPLDSTSISSDGMDKVLVDQEGNLWIGTIEGLNLFDYDTETFIRYQHDPNNPQSLSDNTIRCMYEDSEQTLWVGTNFGGLNRFDKQSGTFQHYRYDKEDLASISDDNIRAIYEDRQGTLWIGTGGPTPTNEGGLNRFDRETETFTRFLADPENEKALMENRVWSMYEDSGGTFWVGSWGENGLHQMDRQTGTFTRLQFDSQNPTQPSTPWLRTRDLSDPGFGTGITNIYEDQSGAFWITAFLGGLDRFDLTTGQREHYEAQGNDPRSLGLNWLFGDILEDRQTILWLTSAGNGIYKVLPGEFHQYHHPSEELNILSIFEDSKSVLWIGTDKGVYQLNQTQQLITPVAAMEGAFYVLMGESIQAIAEDRRGNLWLGSSNGLHQWNPSTRKVTSFYHQPNEPNNLSHNSITTLCLSKIDSNILWVLSGDNVLHRLNIRDLQWDQFPVMDGDSLLSVWNQNHQKIIALQEDSQGKLWFGTDISAFFCWDPIADTLAVFHNHVTWSICFHEDRKGMFWIGSRLNGLIHFDPNSGEVLQRFNEKSGLSSGRINGILEDETANLWLSNMDGYISRLNPKTGFIKDFNHKDGLRKNSFLPGSFHESKDGIFFYGGLNGLTAFDPKAFEPNPFPPDVMIREVLINGKSVKVGQKKSLDLTHQKNDLTFVFDVLHYSRPTENQAIVQLEGYDPNWQPSKSGQQGEAKYTNLDPGTYTFKVKAASSEGIWTETETMLSVIIHPPWWQTWWAYALYVIASFVILFVGYMIQKRRWMLQASLQLEQAETLRLKELDDFKSRLYTNISHEFRTPLTIIQGLADQMEENPRWRTKERIGLIRRNSDKLLSLVKQMLDLSKLEAGKLEPKYIQGDVIKYLNYLVESFHSLALSQQITLSFATHIDHLLMDFDPEKLQQVISNLVSNALKFTPEYGKITLSAHRSDEGKGHNYLDIKVKDSGMGIPNDKLPFIFDRFYQVDNSTKRKGEGTGLGLALVKELLDLMGGSIVANSKLGKGTIFTVRLPIHNEAKLATTEFGSQYKKEVVPLLDNPFKIETKTDAPIVLLVEDNPDVIYYLRNCLEDQYQIICASNGREGIDLALESIPDLIVSDVMMPEVDGFEMCQVLKMDERTNHIPIVLLTAKVTQDDKIEGLSHGADAYLSKPFQKKELLLRLRNLLELRRQVQRKYQDQDQANVSHEDDFLQKVRKQIEMRLEDSDFNVMQLSHSLGMSRVQVYRKLKAISGLSTSQYIRTIRLQKALDLLKHSDLTIAEIGYEVGFKDPGHFSRSFSQHFGTSPSETRK